MMVVLICISMHDSCMQINDVNLVRVGMCSLKQGWEGQATAGQDARGERSPGGTLPEALSEPLGGLPDALL
jgi:hypothetical protein